MLRKDINEYRGRLDKTLASPELTNNETVRTLVKNQILQSSSSLSEEECENVVERRSKEVFSFLVMLRSASENDLERLRSSEESHVAWKVKQDTEELRVMYREGPEGTPFHSLLAEGYVDGPVDICLCISCESELYKEWWPQTVVPTFKVISSECLQRVRIGEQISLVRMKVSWPLSSREAVMHYFVFEYFRDGLVVVVLNTISDTETLTTSTHGFTRDGIPDAQDLVRIDVVGGFAIQKVTANRSFFRTIANMDIKLDFVPPAFINFMSRQLIGSGFKLYKKAVASVSKGDEKFAKALGGPLYARIRKALHAEKESTGSPNLENLNKQEPMKLESTEAFQDNDADNFDHHSGYAIVPGATEIVVPNGISSNEIEEIEELNADNFDHHSGSAIVAGATEIVVPNGISSNEIEQIEEFNADTNQLTAEHIITDRMMKYIRADKKKVGLTTEAVEIVHENTRVEVNKKKVVIRPEVEQALDTLEKAIFMFREYNINQTKKVQSDISKQNLTNIENDFVEKHLSPEADQTTTEIGNHVGSTDVISNGPRNSSSGRSSRQKGCNSLPRETNQSKITPASSDEELPSPSHTATIVQHSAVSKTTYSTVLEKITDANTVSVTTKRKVKKSWFCCVHVNPGQ